MLTTTRLPLLPHWFLLSLSLAACGGTDATEGEEYIWPEGTESTEDEGHLWPAGPSELESVEPVSEAGDEENQCVGVRGCVYTWESCCSHAAWITGASACPLRCCFPPGYVTSSANNCCTYKAAYVGGRLTCIW